MQGLLKSHIALFIVQLMYGANYVIAKGLMPKVVGPNGFILIRALGAVALFWTVFLFNKEKVERKDLGRLALCGLFGVACNQLMFFNGLSLTSPLNASVIMTMTPVIVLILSVLILKEKVRGIQLIGILIGAIGSVLFIMQNSEGTYASDQGDIFIILNATSYSFYLVLVKPLMKKYNPLTVISYVFSFGLIYVLLWVPSSQEFLSVGWGELSTSEIWKLVFVVVGVTFVPYLLNVYAMKRVSPSVTAVYLYLQPMLAGLFVFIFSMLGQEDYTGDMNWIKGLSALVIFVGVYLVIRPAKKLKTE